jgi:hypothetical protein
MTIMENKKVKHIGYFSDVEDLKFYADKTADEIVADMNSSNFYKVEDETIAELDELVIGEIKYTTDSKYAVISDLPIDMNLLGQDGVCDFYIDVYQII